MTLIEKKMIEFVWRFLEVTEYPQVQSLIRMMKRMLELVEVLVGCGEDGEILDRIGEFEDQVAPVFVVLYVIVTQRSSSPSLSLNNIDG